MIKIIKNYVAYDLESSYKIIIRNSGMLEYINFKTYGQNRMRVG